MALPYLREEDFLIRRDFIMSDANRALVFAVQDALREAFGLPDHVFINATPIMAPERLLIEDGTPCTVLIKIHSVHSRTSGTRRVPQIAYSMVVQHDGAAILWTGDLDDNAARYRREPPRVLITDIFHKLALTPELRKKIKAFIPSTP